MKPGGALDTFGRAFLEVIDYRVINLIGLFVLLVAVVMHRRANGSWPSKEDVIRAAMGVLMVGTAVTVFIVFFLTKPPYVEALSSDGISVSAFITFIFMCGSGIAEIKRLLEKKKG